MRLIDADALMPRIEESFRNAGLHGEDYKKIRKWITKAPTIEPSKSTDQNVADVPSGDLISRKTLIGAIKKCGEEKIYPQALIETIKALPSADRPQVNSAEWVIQKEREFEELHRPKGEWIDREDSTDMFFLYRYECSVCGGKNVFNSSYCPNCGAHMR